MTHQGGAIVTLQHESGAPHRRQQVMVFDHHVRHHRLGSMFILINQLNAVFVISDPLGGLSGFMGIEQVWNNKAITLGQIKTQFKPVQNIHQKAPLTGRINDFMIMGGAIALFFIGLLIDDKIEFVDADNALVLAGISRG
jgi:hypothetical protein